MPQPKISIQPEPLQNRQPLAAAFEAGHIHLGAGLGEGEVMGTEFYLRVLRSEQLLRELGQRSL